MNIASLLQSIEKNIPTTQEQEYFWTHEERYKIILEQINKVTKRKIDKNDNAATQQKNQTTKEEKLRVLDVGCFPYHLGAAMEKIGFDVYGISSQHEPIQQDKIKICNIENDKFPFKDNFFDLAVFTEVLEHLPQSPLFTLKQIHRVLKPGGHIILTTPNIARSINRGKLLLGKSVTYPLHQILENDGKGSNLYHRHNREYTLSECVKLVSEANFSITKAETFVSYTPWRRRVHPDVLWLKAGKITNYALMLMVESLRDTLMVVGEK